METKHGDLELEEDLAFQQKTWAAERVGWLVMALIALASIVGLIDTGPLSSTREGNPNTLEVEYDRFIHLETPAQLRVKLPTKGSFSIQLPFEYIERADISCVIPQPVNAVSEGGRVTYFFSGRPGTAQVLFDMTAREPGSLKGSVQSGQHRVEFTQFVFP
jgi:hypothetical protein